ncbi:MAG: hypothetical protein A2Y38_18565 [Spirochaetes bacterium GWB1_59_5]|nr:MAG: hypothetical protein A2Y38_18565 [Spirochaetes bacterium GWB1_59_5]
MIIQIATELTYVPKWNSNRDLPADEQIVAHYKVISIKDKGRVLKKPDVEFQYDPAGQVKGGSVAISFDRKPVIAAMLTRLDNCGWKDKTGEHAIIRAIDFDEAPTAFDSLADELGEFFRSELEKKLDEKN